MTRSFRTVWRPFPSASGLGVGMDGALRAIIARVSRATARYRQRRRLAELDDHLLSDIGLTRGDVEQECAKRFWET